MATSNRIRALNRLPFDFEDGIKIGGVDITNLKDIGNPGGSALVNYESGRSVQSVLDTNVSLADYTALRAYSGRATMVRIMGDGIAGLFKYEATDTTSIDNGGTIIVSGTKRWKRVFDGAVNVKWFGAKGDDVTDDGVSMIAAHTFANNQGKVLEIPDGIYRTSLSFSFIGIGKSHWKGDGFCQIRFVNVITGVVLLNLGPNSAWAIFENIRFIDSVPGTSTAIEIKDSRSPNVISNWKNRFTGCRFDDFGIAVYFNAAGNYLSNSTSDQDFCSESMFFHCKIKNCRLGVLNRNLQALNNTFVQTDIENDEALEQYEMIRDESGGGLLFLGGSFIGRGSLYIWKHPAGANTWTNGTVRFIGARVEVRSDATPHIGAVFKQDPLGVTTGTSNALIEFSGDIIGVGSAISVDLIKYAGKLVATFNINAPNFSNLYIRNHPVEGISSSVTSGAIGEVIVNSPACKALKFVIDTDSAYGTTSLRFPAKVTITSGRTASGGSSTDSFGFIGITQSGNSNLAFGLQSSTVNSVTYNDPVVAAGWKTIKAKLPLNIRPIKFTLYKHPVRWGSNFVVRLYAVKDNSSWVNPATFDPITDTIGVISTITTGPNSAGAFIADIKPLSNVFGDSFMPGISLLWTEGRIYVESDQSTSTSFIGGSFTIDYM